MNQRSTSKDNVDNRSTYLDQHAIVKRSVAENSFNAIVGDEIIRSDRIKIYAKVLEKLGLDATNSFEIFGDNPSYETEMEVRDEKTLSRPCFLCGRWIPANVERQYAALQAFG